MLDMDDAKPEPWCPGCEPDVNPITAYVYERRCWKHEPDLTGSADDAMKKLLGPTIQPNFWTDR